MSVYNKSVPLERLVHRSDVDGRRVCRTYRNLFEKVLLLIEQPEKCADPPAHLNLSNTANVKRSTC